MKADEIRLGRVSQNISLKQLAKVAGVHPSHLSRIERGTVQPSPLVLSSIEAAIGARQLTLSPLLVVANGGDVAEESANGDAAKGVDPRNSLNDLSGKEWIQETKSVWRQKGLGANHDHTKYEKLHPAPFSFQDVARLIRLFTKRDMLVLDPFAGVGSTLKAAAIEGRRGIGIELSQKWAEIARVRLGEEVPGHSGQQIWCMDIREALGKIPSESLDLVVTSPPYWGILNKRPDHKTKEVRLANGLAQNYSDDSRDLANTPNYEAFLQTLADVFRQLASKLKPGRYCAIIVSDFKHGSRFYSFHSDLATAIGCGTLELHGITILEQTHKALYPYGYPYAYVPNIHHQYILILRKPNSNVGKKGGAANPRGRGASGSVSNLEAAMKALRELPYKQAPMSSRHWGHGRHGLCSFPSKMKPALAATLVDLFTTSTSAVLDPFSGCGTVPFEAALQGRKSMGSDLSPLSYVLTHGKVVPPEVSEVKELLARLRKPVAGASKRIDELLEYMEEEIQEYYHPKTAAEIVAAQRFLARESNGFATGRGALFVAAALAHILHGNRPYALSRRSHNIIPIPPKGPRPYKSLLASLEEKCERMLAIPLPASFRPGEAIRASASELPLKPRSISTVITSPPFLASTEFLRQNRLRHWFVGWGYEKQAEMKKQFLEHARDVTPYNPIIQELHRVLVSGGLAVLHVGIVKAKNMADLLSPIFAECGFDEIGRVWEDVSDMETHGRTDRGGTHTHGVIVWRKR